jgi:hypothetical protein
MPTALDQIVNVNISQQTSAVPQASFGIPLIVGPTGFGNSDVIRYYTSAAAMLLDGFTTGSPEYIYAAEAFEQDLSPTEIGIGKRLPAVAQVDTLMVNTLVATGHAYAFTVNGHVLTYTSASDTQQSILTALNVLLAALTSPPATGVVTGTGAGATLTLTSVVPGNPVTYTAVDADMTLANVTPNHGIADDLNAILADPLGNNWYGMALCSNVAADIEQAAALTESLKKIFIGATADAAVDTGSTSDVASLLQAKAYRRTALLYSPVSAALGMDAAWLGGQLPQPVGSSTWKFKTLVGIATDTFSATSRARLIGLPGVSLGKGVNIYEKVGGVPITEEGWMVGGQFIDVTIGVDWLESTIQNNVFTQLVNNPKIPYTDKGETVIENAVRQSLKQASDDGGNGLLDHTTIVVTTTPVADIPQADRAARILPVGAITFTARLTGAFHFVVINGTVTV